ncbi:MAG TPA: ATP-binding protein, partial [Chloroflexota bacterium]
SVAERAGVQLNVEPIDLTMYADPDRLVQVFTNLLSNAIKFSDRGTTVDIGASLLAEDRVRIETRDAGRGIPDDQLERIFERFQQVDASDSRLKGGTGLGLAICRKIVEQHGGRIWAESSPSGSTFCIELPIDSRRAAGSDSLHRMSHKQDM